MPSVCCRLCGYPDRPVNLITPCVCAKRDDTLLCHASCLVQHIEQSLQHRFGTNEQAAATCPSCGKPYYLNLRWRLRFSAERAFSSFSIEQYCHFIGLLFMLGLFTAVAWLSVSHPSGPLPQTEVPSRSTALWVAGLFVLVVGSALVGMAQVLRRICRHQTQAELADHVV